MEGTARSFAIAACAALAAGFAAQASAQSIPTPRGVCVANCGPYPSPVYIPQGPSPEELRRLREAKDSKEAAEYAEDKGIEAHEKGDFEAAVAWFKEALEYAPGDGHLMQQLATSERRANEARERRAAETRRSLEAAGNTTAIRQLTGAEQDSRAAVPGADRDRAGRPFDQRQVLGGGVPVYAGGARPEPVVPANRRTPQITALERQRTETKQQIQAIEQRLATLDPKKDSVAIAKAKDEKSRAESKVQFLNFSISEALDKPAAPGAQ